MRCECFIESDPLLPGNRFQKLHALRAHVSFRDIHDAPESHIILVCKHTKIAEGILDLHPREKLRPAVHGIGDLFFEECFLKIPCHVVSPIKKRHVLVGNVMVMKHVYFFADPSGFILCCFQMEAGHLLPARLVSDEILPHAILIL